VTPIGPDTVGVALMSSELPVDFDRLLQSFPDLRARLEGAEAISRDRGAGPFGQRPLAVARGNLALLGDASGSLDPITGEGLSITFAQAHSLIRSLERGRIGDYAVAHRRIVRMPRLVTGMLLGIERHGWLKRRMVQTLASHPSVFAELVDVAACGRLSSILPDIRIRQSAT
jgi:flavin-dependent dehydrogenase